MKKYGWIYTLPCREKFSVELKACGSLSYTPLCAQPFLKLSLNGVPGNDTPLRLCIDKLILTTAVPELFPLQGKNTLKSTKRIRKEN